MTENTTPIIEVEKPIICTLVTVDFVAKKVLARIRLGDL